MRNNILEKAWPEWQIEKLLGRGSFGVVYKAIRKEHNVESYAAIKVIAIPSDISEVDSLRSEGLDENTARTYFEGIVNDFVNEIQLMESLKGVPNIVIVEDYKVVEKAGEIGWDIYIRMELLTPFNAYICDKKLSEDEVIKLGCDICTALEICGRRNIIHRDIKPENIFVNDFGYFKLGDFGIARKLENVTGGLSQKGTFNYMAPEVAIGKDYDARADIYSLGIVLYRLMNSNRLPFLDTEKQLLNPNERRNAVERRIRGEELPAPKDASPKMAEVILRACAADPDHRFSSAAEMKQALLGVHKGSGAHETELTSIDEIRSARQAVHKDTKADNTAAVRSVSAADVPNMEPTAETVQEAQKKKKKALIAAFAVAVLVVTGVFVIPHFSDSAEASTIPTGTNDLAVEYNSNMVPIHGGNGSDTTILSVSADPLGADLLPKTVAPQLTEHHAQIIASTYEDSTPAPTISIKPQKPAASASTPDTTPAKTPIQTPVQVAKPTPTPFQPPTLATTPTPKLTPTPTPTPKPTPVPTPKSTPVSTPKPMVTVTLNPLPTPVVDPPDPQFTATVDFVVPPVDTPLPLPPDSIDEEIWEDIIIGRIDVLPGVSDRLK